MSSFILNDDVLQLGIKLEKSGEIVAAQKLYLKVIQSNAKLNNQEDVLVYFYGSKIYDTPISTYSEVVDYCFIATCAKSLYYLITSKSPASYIGGWALTSKNVVSTPESSRVMTFFNWIKNVKKLSNEDYLILKSMKDILSSTNKVSLKMSNKVSIKSLHDIIIDIKYDKIKVLGNELV